ncbi:MAG: DUF998 domain-containing protein [bacterium]|nr:DUF998 domain-containing protein [bacterium]
MNRINAARALAFCTVLFGFAFYVIGGLLKPGYSSSSSFISELNASGTPWALQFGFFGFVPLGLLFAAFLIAARPHVRMHGASKLGWWLLWAQPVDLVLAVLAPCDAGCPLQGSSAQVIHSLHGGIACVATGLGLSLLAFAPALAGEHSWARFFLRLSGAVYVLAYMALLSPDIMPVRGLLQRSADAFLAASLLLIACRMIQPHQDPRFQCPDWRPHE